MKTNLLVYGLINVWNQSIRLAIDPILKVIEIGRELGYHYYSSASFSMYAHISLFSGLNLLELNDEIEELNKTSTLSPVTNSIHHLVLRFLGKEKSYPTTSFLEKVNDELHAFLVRLHIIIIDYNFYEYESVAEIIKNSKPFSSSINCMYAYSVYIFYQGLISIAQLKKLNIDDAEMWKHAVRQSISQLEIWSRAAPQNFQNKRNLLIAENLSIYSNDYKETLVAYNSAIRLSRSSDFIHEEALAAEKAGLYCIEKSLFSEASKYVSHAYKMYDKWGCTSKLHQLKSTIGVYINDSAESLDIFDKSDSQDVYVDVSSSHSSLSEIR